MFPRVYLLFICLKIAALKRPNIIFVLTDDQDLTLGSLNYMNKTLTLIANQGATFTNSYVNAPICCPSRSSILTGRYPHNLQVYNNSITGGCSSLHWQQFHEQNTIATSLKKLNYTTFYAGKYLNQYGHEAVGGTAHVPPGYDYWYGLKGNSVYYNYTLSINGKEQRFRNFYLTDLMRQYALRFLNENSDNSFFMILATPAAHAPFQPAPRHQGYFPQVEADRKSPFNVTPIAKHWVVTMPPSSLPDDVTILDDIHRNRLRTLQAVDDLIGSLVSKLEQMKLLNETYLLFSSDNGFHIGQFTQPWDKRQPYESDIHVPFVIRGPGIKPKSLIKRPMVSVDIAPTILDLAGIKMADTDGESLKNTLLGLEEDKVQKTIYIEYWGEGNANTVDPNCKLADNDQLSECSIDNWCKCQDSKNNTYRCLMDFANDDKIFKFCTFPKGFHEVYNLIRDPHEIVNLYQNLTTEEFDYFTRKIDSMAKCYGEECTI